MTQKTLSELKGLDLASLNTELECACREEFELNLKLKTGSLKETHLLKAARKHIARLKTLIHAKRV